MIHLKRGIKLDIVIFGIGKYYQERKEELASYIDIHPIAAIDNNPYIQGTFVDGFPLYAVEQLELI